MNPGIFWVLLTPMPISDGVFDAYGDASSYMSALPIPELCGQPTALAGLDQGIARLSISQIVLTKWLT